MAEIVPFPLTRRRRFIARQVNAILGMREAAGERHLIRQLELQATTLKRKGVPADIVTREVRAMETAIRAECWHALLTGGAA